VTPHASPTGGASSADAGAPARIPSRIPSLDGLRALSILLVVVHHMVDTAAAPRFVRPVTSAIDAGALGVRVFFVISGFLITGILARELQRTGTLSLRNFYLRRTLRIFPASYVFLMVLALLAFMGVVAVSRTELLAAFTYTINFWRGHPAWDVGHLWSLAVEEQFYLLWPATLLLLGMRRGAVLAAALIVIVPPLRLAEILGFDWFAREVTMPFVSYADWLAAGAVLTLAGPRLAQWARYRAVRQSGWWTLFLVASGLAAWTAFGHWRLRELTAVWTAIAVALLIDQLTNESRTFAARLLAVRPLVWIGRISYSLYLWQELFLDRASTAWWTRFPVNVVLAFVAAALSYYFVEQPVLAWRDRRRQGVRQVA